MVDRICVDMKVSQDARSVVVEAEDHEGSIVVLTQPETENDQREVPLDGDEVLIPSSEKESEYLYRKKLLTVNGMHTVLAFRTLCQWAATQVNCTNVE